MEEGKETVSCAEFWLSRFWLLYWVLKFNGPQLRPLYNCQPPDYNSRGLNGLGTRPRTSAIEEIDRLRPIVDQLKIDAEIRGQDPKNRALEAGREWHEGDDF